MIAYQNEFIFIYSCSSQRFFKFYVLQFTLTYLTLWHSMMEGNEPLLNKIIVGIIKDA